MSVELSLELLYYLNLLVSSLPIEQGLKSR